jgi:VanZ family protein
MTSLKTGRKRRPLNYKYAWIPVILGLIVIRCESTQVMGASHTEAWLLQVMNLFRPQTLTPHFVFLDGILRKSGHFLGYGCLGTLAARAWAAQIRRRVPMTWTAVRLWGGALGVATVFLVACADEYHQSFLPGRTSSFHDVLIDTSGALLLGAIYFGVMAVRRRRLGESLGTLRLMRSLRDGRRIAAGVLGLVA